MAEKSLGFTGTTVAAIVSGLVVPGGIALFTYFFPGAAAAVWVVSAINATWSHLLEASHAVRAFADLPVPVWAVAVVVGVIIIGSLACRRASTTTPPHPWALPELSDRVLEVLAVADGSPLQAGRIGEVLNVRRLAIEGLAEYLISKGLVSSNPFSAGALLSLTSSGRDYVFEHGLTGDDSLVAKLQQVNEAHSRDWMRR